MMLSNVKTIVAVTLICMLLGCSNTTIDNTNSEEEKRFLAEDANKVALFIVGDERDSFDLEEDAEINNIQSIFNASSLKRAQQKYEFLKLKEEPTYIVFDNKEEIYRTDDYNQLVNFLKNNTGN
ncbi:hypothetical protein [Fictibacillus arsenicus]|uniref:Uncharacterized protein n=1 Tax=Fictibacillus arsenicus TaxID=255247 RepID=A0A1V3GB08_9BACL|nr:hypothetical protein [Fictibacillus arsenicus]OOE14035.1 hypothetical protein UN64_02140 [Fictibacillus arsenicus]